MPRIPKPTFLTVKHIQEYFGVSEDKAKSIAGKCRPVGLYLRNDNPLFWIEDIQKELNKN